MCIALLATTACTSHDEPEANYIDMPVRITIPVEGAATRAIGDPGAADAVNLPTHAYIYLVTYISQADANDTTNMAYTYSHLTLKKENWDNGTPLADGSFIYTYTGEVSLRKEVDVKVGRVYVALSNDAISPSKTTDCASEQQVRNVTFDIPAKFFTTVDGKYEANANQLNDFLKNLYSTPATLTYTSLPTTPTDYSAYNGQYYGTILDITTNVPHLNIVCYHVAAKLDVTWNVDQSAQAGQKIKSIKATGLYRKSCSLFNPAVNSTVITTATETYSHSFATINQGNQWYGRASMYVIQRPESETKKTQTFNFEIKVEDSSTSPSATITKYGTATAEYVNTGVTFTPWMRGTININQSSQ